MYDVADFSQQTRSFLHGVLHRCDLRPRRSADGATPDNSGTEACSAGAANRANDEATSDNCEAACDNRKASSSSDDEAFRTCAAAAPYA